MHDIASLMRSRKSWTETHRVDLAVRYYACAVWLPPAWVFTTDSSALVGRVEHDALPAHRSAADRTGLEEA